MLRKNLITVVDLLVLLISLLVFILAETKAVELVYPWHMALCYGLGVIGIVHIIYSAFNKKLLSLGFGGLLFVVFVTYLVFSVLKIENVALGIVIIVVAIIILALLKYLFNIRSAFVGDNKVPGYKNYKERRKQETLNDISSDEE